MEYGFLKASLLKAKHYIELTKPRVMMLVVFSGMTALFMEGESLKKPLDFFLVTLALYLTGGCANALNQYFERNLDKQMVRTKHKRPLPGNKMSPNQALVFALGLGIVGVLIFKLRFNELSAGLSFMTILFYSLFYTLYLKKKRFKTL